MSMKGYAPDVKILTTGGIRPGKPSTNRTSGAQLSKSGSLHSDASRWTGDTGRSYLSPVQEEFELLEYEWPDLPPVQQIRQALARDRVSKGVDYLLPVDKTKNSVDGVFRTNLRIMFKEPYLNDTETYDEEKIRKLAKHHFDTNTLPTINRPKYTELDTRGLRINQESEKHRLMYTQSAPANSIVGRESKVESLRQRSSLNFPLKQRLPPEAQKLKDEAERILRSVQEKDQDNEDVYDPTLRDRQILNEQAMGKYRKSPDKRRPIHRQRTLPSREMMRSLASRGRTPPKTKAGKFRTYDDLKNSQVPVKREMPSRLRSRFMSDARSEAVWDWLNKDEKITPFSYFLEICS